MNMSVRKLTVAGLLGAVSAVLGLVPGLGFIPFPTGQAVTIMQIPVVLAAVAEGPAVGLFVGLIFGLTSFLRATNPAFADPLVAILPRLFIGVFSAYAFRALRRRNLTLALGAAGVVGTLTNTGLVLGMILLRGYWPLELVWTVAVTHAPLELLVGTFAVVTVGLALHRAGYIRVAYQPTGQNP